MDTLNNLPDECGCGTLVSISYMGHSTSCDDFTTSAHSYVVPKYVRDVATLIANSAESRNMFLSEVTRTCLEAAKKDKADANQAITSQLVQPPTNTNITDTKTIYSTSSYRNPLPNQLHQSFIHQAQQ